MTTMEVEPSSSPTSPEPTSPTLDSTKPANSSLETIATTPSLSTPKERMQTSHALEAKFWPDVREQCEKSFLYVDRIGSWRPILDSLTVFFSGIFNVSPPTTTRSFESSKTSDSPPHPALQLIGT